MRPWEEDQDEYMSEIDISESECGSMLESGCHYSLSKACFNSINYHDNVKTELYIKKI